jgi:site-specific recombinase XerD
LGVRIGNWLTVEQSRTLLAESAGDGLRGKRDRAILALLIGCGLRRAELVGLGLEDFQVREEHWVIADLIGKGNTSAPFQFPCGRNAQLMSGAMQPR